MRFALLVGLGLLVSCDSEQEPVTSSNALTVTPREIERAPYIAGQDLDLGLPAVEQISVADYAARQQVRELKRADEGSLTRWAQGVRTFAASRAAPPLSIVLVTADDAPGRSLDSQVSHKVTASAQFGGPAIQLGVPFELLQYAIDGGPLQCGGLSLDPGQSALVVSYEKEPGRQILIQDLENGHHGWAFPQPGADGVYVLDGGAAITGPALAEALR